MLSDRPALASPRRQRSAASSFSERIAADVRGTIERHYLGSSPCELLVALMSRPGRALCNPKKAKWPAMVRQVAVALGASEDDALPAAAAVEFIIGALDVVDDVIDDELEEGLSTNRCLNATLALLALAEACTLRLSQRLSPSQTAVIHESISSALVEATKGEDLDILYEDRPEVDEQAALEMTAQKSGALVAMAFRIAAAVATEDSPTIEQLGAMGRSVGVIWQLENDAQACTARGAAEATDLRLRKKTLPVAYALQCAQAEGNADFLALFASGQPLSDAQIARAQQFIADCGGLHYTWTVSETVRRHAGEDLEVLRRTLGAGVAEDLRSLIPPLPAMAALG